MFVPPSSIETTLSFLSSGRSTPSFPRRPSRTARSCACSARRRCASRRPGCDRAAPRDRAPPAAARRSGGSDRGAARWNAPPGTRPCTGTPRDTALAIFITPLVSRPLPIKNPPACGGRRVLRMLGWSCLSSQRAIPTDRTNPARLDSSDPDRDGRGGRHSALSISDDEFGGQTSGRLGPADLQDFQQSGGILPRGDEAHRPEHPRLRLELGIRDGRGDDGEHRRPVNPCAQHEMQPVVRPEPVRRHQRVERVPSERVPPPRRSRPPG